MCFCSCWRLDGWVWTIESRDLRCADVALAGVTYKSEVDLFINKEAGKCQQAFHLLHPRHYFFPLLVFFFSHMFTCMPNQLCSSSPELPPAASNWSPQPSKSIFLINQSFFFLLADAALASQIMWWLVKSLFLHIRMQGGPHRMTVPCPAAIAGTGETVLPWVRPWRSRPRRSSNDRSWWCGASS